ncbi:MAG: hypothetical protein ACRC8W_22015 [Plesiomonas shigelloides]
MNLTDGRLGAAVGAGTSGSGIATWLEMIPNEIGKLATLVGIILSLVLIVMHVRKMRQDARDGEIREQEAEARRREAGLREELLRVQIAKEKGQ